MLVELNPTGNDANHGGRFIEDLQCTGTQHRTGGANGFVIQRRVQFGFGEDRGRRTTGSPELQLVSFANTAGKLNELTHGDSEGGLELARVLHVT